MEKSVATRKFQTEQSVHSDSVRKGPYAIERSVDPNKVVIKRRFGEGSKPLFQRGDIVVNRKSVINSAEDHTEKQLASGSSIYEDLANSRQKERRNSTDSSSPERYQKYKKSNNECASGSNTSASRHTEVHKPAFDSHGSAGKRTVRRDSSPTYSHRRRTPEKVPYFLDEIRERDRLRRKYGTKPEKPSPSPPLLSRSRRKRSRTTSRSRSHSLDSAKFKNRSKSLRTQHRSISRDRYLGGSNRRERTRSYKTKGNTYSQYRHRSEDRSTSGRRHRSLRPTSKSRSRSRDRLTRSRTPRSHNERSKHRYREQDRPSNNEFAQRSLPQPQIITIPVPLPADFMNYTYSTWPTPNQWAPRMAHAPRYGPPAAYHMSTILPAAVMPPLRLPLPAFGLPPPPLHYGGRGFRFPMQYGSSRPWRTFDRKSHRM